MALRANMASTTASATQISAAAMVMMNSVSDWPVWSGESSRAPSATSMTLAALRISSTPMSTRTALRRASTP